MLSPVGLPRSDHLECVVIDQRDPAGTFGTVGATQRRHEDAVRSAVHRIRARVSRFGGKLTGLDRAGHHRMARVGLGVEHIRRRRTDTGDEQISPLKMADVPLVTQRARARAPAEVVQFVAGRRQLGPADHAAVRRGGRLAVDHGERVFRPTRRVERSYVGELLGRLVADQSLQPAAEEGDRRQRDARERDDRDRQLR